MPRRSPESPKRKAEPQAQRRPRSSPDDHRETRAAHAAELAEDYVEAIADLTEIEGEARVVDIARLLGVSHVTVVRTVARLQRDGFVTAKPYRAIFLTDSGKALAAHSHRRHTVVLRFLELIGVGDRQARIDAEGIEHHVSDETLRALERLIAKG